MPERLAEISLDESVVVRSGATVAEYMAFENDTEERHEFHNGDIIKMPGVRRTHAVIVANLLSAFGRQLRRRGRIYGEMLKFDIPAYNRIVYPDVMITLGEEEFTEGDMMRLQNPVVVVEVLSRGTARYDRSTKFEYYRSVLSLQEIAFIAQERVFVELYRKKGDEWEFYELTQGSLRLESVQAEITFDDLYDLN